MVLSKAEALPDLLIGENLKRWQNIFRERALSKRKLSFGSKNSIQKLQRVPVIFISILINTYHRPTSLASLGALSEHFEVMHSSMRTTLVQERVMRELQRGSEVCEVCRWECQF